MCWLGINPGVTTATDAEAILKASSQIDKDTIQMDNDGIRTTWFTGSNNTSYWRVGILIEKDLVKSISFGGGMEDFRVDDLVKLLGEPDEISISLRKAADADYIEYVIYYIPEKTSLLAMSGGRLGPDPQDRVTLLSLNVEFSDANSPKWMTEEYNLRQPWLGYGHFNDYLPGATPPALYNPVGP